MTRRRRTHKEVLEAKLLILDKLEKEQAKLNSHNPISAVTAAIIALNAIKIAQIVHSVAGRGRKR